MTISECTPIVSISKRIDSKKGYFFKRSVTSPRTCSADRILTYFPGASFRSAWLQQYVHWNGQPLPKSIVACLGLGFTHGSHISRSGYGKVDRSSINGRDLFLLIPASVLHQRLSMLFHGSSASSLFTKSSIGYSPSPTQIASQLSFMVLSGFNVTWTPPAIRDSSGHFLRISWAICLTKSYSE